MPMRTYQVSFKINGNRCQMVVQASSPTDAKSQVQAHYPSEKIQWLGTREVR